MKLDHPGWRQDVGAGSGGHPAGSQPVPELMQRSEAVPEWTNCSAEPTKATSASSLQHNFHSTPQRRANRRRGGPRVGQRGEPGRVKPCSCRENYTSAEPSLSASSGASAIKPPLALVVSCGFQGQEEGDCGQRGPPFTSTPGRALSTLRAGLFSPESLALSPLDTFYYGERRPGLYRGPRLDATS
ncbi:hypothetical protein DPEC_G00315030 [Dallia pectoralis]|uniref:Uncharacterized protein n=1 Tax=Dallia pectoralis TaxID=75939 RepID=A0ACC2FCB3_DALPE|nr:hypothetical protein DPEC_G00315030 [Dallia pectoralis]